MIKQYVPQEVCLKCQGCCRFKEENSIWSPCLLEEEIEGLIDKEGIPAISVDINKRILLVPGPDTEGFVCPCLNIGDNKCRIYSLRPFECQLYPFLISLRNKKVILTVDLNCPYIKETLNTNSLKEYSEYLASVLNTPAFLHRLKNNPQLIQAYEDVLAVLELKTEDETA